MESPYSSQLSPFYHSLSLTCRMESRRYISFEICGTLPIRFSYSLRVNRPRNPLILRAFAHVSLSARIIARIIKESRVATLSEISFGHVSLALMLCKSYKKRKQLSAFSNILIFSFYHNLPLLQEILSPCAYDDIEQMNSPKTNI